MAPGSRELAIRQRAAQLGLDPDAVVAIGSVEGATALRGGDSVGDHGTSFGFAQLHAGGALPASIWARGPAYANAWANSPAGINYALEGMARAAKGLKGQAAVQAISSRFERPADVAGEVSKAMGFYGGAPSATGGPAMTTAAPTSGSPIGALNADAARSMTAAFLLQQSAATAAGEPPAAGDLLALAVARKQAQATQNTFGAQPQQAGSPVRTALGKSAAPQGAFKIGDPVVGGTRIGAEHSTEGLAGYPAHDYFAPAGSAAVAPITGKVVRLSGHDPAQGPIEGPHGPLGWSVYIQGDDGHTYYLTHMGTRTVRPGETVKAGQPIGTVANYDKYGTPSHIHMGVH